MLSGKQALGLVLLFASTTAAEARLLGYADGSDVVLVWSCAGTYDVHRGTTTTGPFSVIGRSDTGTFTDVGAVPGPPANPPLYYYYLVWVAGPGPTVCPGAAFKINLDLEPDSSAPFGNLISLPFLFYPDGNLGHTPQTYRDLCQAYPALTYIGYYASDGCQRIKMHSCASPLEGGELVAGEGYYLRVAAPATLDLVGSHDDNYAPNKGGIASYTLYACAGCEEGRNLVSIPYHTMATTVQGICDQVGPELIAIEEYDAGLNRLVRHTCGLPATDFPITPGRALTLEVSADTSLALEVY